MELELNGVTFMTKLTLIMKKINNMPFHKIKLREENWYMTIKRSMQEGAKIYVQ